VGSDTTATRTLVPQQVIIPSAGIPSLFKQDVGKHTSLASLRTTTCLTTTSTMSPRRCQHRKSLQRPQKQHSEGPLSALAQRGALAFLTFLSRFLGGHAATVAS
jgi:hypothetical protein